MSTNAFRRLVPKAARHLQPWLSDQPAFFDLVIAFNLTGFGLIGMLLGLGIARVSTATLPTDFQRGVAYCLTLFGALMICAAVRLVRARGQALGVQRIACSNSLTQSASCRGNPAKRHRTGHITPTKLDTAAKGSVHLRQAIWTASPNELVTAASLMVIGRAQSLSDVADALPFRLRIESPLSTSLWLL